MKVGFLGMGVMGLPMAKNLVKKSGHEIVGFDVADKRLEEFAAAGGTAVKDADEIYKTCDIIMQILPPTRSSVTPWKRPSSLASPAASS